MQFIKQFIREDEGQDVVEYGLLVATVGLVVLVGIGAFGTSMKTWFGKLTDAITAN